MATKSKKASGSSKSNIDLGKERKRRISDFRAKKHLDGVIIPNLDQAVNMLVDKALDLELQSA